MTKFELLKAKTYENVELNDYKWLEQAIEESKARKIDVEIKKAINKNIKLFQENDIHIGDILEMMANDVQSIMKK